MLEWEGLRRDKVSYVNFETGDGVERLNRIREARRVTRSQYVANKIGIVKDTYSNGETGFMRFVDSIVPDRLYILDEPENSLSCVPNIVNCSGQYLSRNEIGTAITSS